MEDQYLTPAEVSSLTRGQVSVRNLAELRYSGGGPRYFKPTRKTILYSRAAVTAWIESRAFDRSDMPVPRSA